MKGDEVKRWKVLGGRTGMKGEGNRMMMKSRGEGVEGVLVE